MTKQSKKNIHLLLELAYNGTMNQFDEFYGDSVSYQELEQESYIELKGMLVMEIGRIKFRKARDIVVKNGLTCRLEMSKAQCDKLFSIYEENKNNNSYSSPFKFLHGFKIRNLRMDDELNKTKENDKR